MTCIIYNFRAEATHTAEILTYVVTGEKYSLHVVITGTTFHIGTSIPVDGCLIKV